MITLHAHQASSVKKVYDSWLSGNTNCILVEPTGSGKTIILGQFARDSVNTNHVVIIFAHRDVLISQISLSLCAMGVVHGFIAQNKIITDITNNQVEDFGRSFYDSSASVIVASVNTYVRRLDKGLLNNLLPMVNLWIQDESHHLLDENIWGKCVNSLPNAKGLGVTATPLRSDGRGLGRGIKTFDSNGDLIKSTNDGVFDEMIVGSSMGKLIENGFLSPYKIFVPPSLLDMNGMRITKSGDWNQKELAQRTDRADITGDSVQQYLKLAEGKQCITFCVNIAHSDHVAEEFNKAGICSVSLSSKTKPKLRRDAVKDFKKGKIINLVNCDLFGEGFDVPAVACVIMLRKTDSYGLFKQQFGRLLRVIDGKDYGILIDQVGNVQRHCNYGAPHDDPEWTLERAVKKSGDGEKSNARVCPECFSYYTPTIRNKFICRECSHEETTNEVNAEMQKFIIDNSDLVEMNVDFISQLLTERKKVDQTPERVRQNMVNSNMKKIVVDSAVNNHTKRQFAQTRLRRDLQAFGLRIMHEKQWDLKTFQLYFEKTFKVNILKAQVLSERLTLELLEKIKNENA